MKNCCFKFKMAPESKMEAENCFQHIVLRSMFFQNVLRHFPSFAIHHGVKNKDGFQIKINKIHTEPYIKSRLTYEMTLALQPMFEFSFIKFSYFKSKNIKIHLKKNIQFHIENILLLRCPCTNLSPCSNNDQ
jgi:hypothetical protein